MLLTGCAKVTSHYADSSKACKPAECTCIYLAEAHFLLAVVNCQLHNRLSAVAYSEGGSH